MLKKDVLKLFLADSDVRQQMFDSAIMCAAESVEIKDWIEEFAVDSVVVYYNKSGLTYAELRFCRTKFGRNLGRIEGLSVSYNFVTDISKALHHGQDRHGFQNIVGKTRYVVILRGIRGDFYEQK